MMTFSLKIKTAEDLAAEATTKAREDAREKARAYLAETDWMVVRMAETGQPVPQDILELRAAARKAANGG